MNSGRQNGDEDESQPERPAQSLMHVTSDQIRGMFTFSIETGCEVGLREERRQVEIGLEADVDGERRDQPLDPRRAAGSGCGSGSGR